MRGLESNFSRNVLKRAYLVRAVSPRSRRRCGGTTLLIELPAGGQNKNPRAGAVRDLVVQILNRWISRAMPCCDPSGESGRLAGRRSQSLRGPRGQLGRGWVDRGPLISSYQASSRSPGLA
jgi:hypothetical protein